MHLSILSRLALPYPNPIRSCPRLSCPIFFFGCFFSLSIHLSVLPFWAHQNSPSRPISIRSSLALKLELAGASFTSIMQLTPMIRTRFPSIDVWAQRLATGSGSNRCHWRAAPWGPASFDGGFSGSRLHSPPPFL